KGSGIDNVEYPIDSTRRASSIQAAPSLALDAWTANRKGRSCGLTRGHIVGALPVPGAAHRPDFFRPDANAYNPCRQTVEIRCPEQDPGRQWQLQGSPGQDRLDDGRLQQRLEALSECSRQPPPALDPGQQPVGDLTTPPRPDEDVVGSHRILDSQVQADTADRTHGVGGVPDQEQPREPPAVHMVRADCKQLDVVPVADLAYTLAELGRQLK